MPRTRWSDRPGAGIDRFDAAHGQQVAMPDQQPTNHVLDADTDDVSRLAAVSR